MHHQIVHIYFLLHTHTGKGPFCKDGIWATKGNDFSEMQLSPLLFFSLSKFHGLLLTSSFLLLLLPYIGTHLQKPLMKVIYIYSALDRVLTSSQGFSPRTNAWAGLWDLLQAQAVFPLLSSHGHMWTYISQHLLLKSSLFCLKWVLEHTLVAR